MGSSRITLLHSIHRSKTDSVLREGLKACSAFDHLGLAMRQGVVFCWLRKEDDRMWGNNADYAYVQATVDRSRCRVADMEFSSLAMMYLQGSGGRPGNTQAAALLAKLYELTSVPLSDYRGGMFCTPEVLVVGDIGAECITLA